ncbi:uncharacterized protein SCHCODRAFT_01220509 [Schizophyllum commune H4-8]|uniref:uncharacterized protein n=1 Tax=Schizophyllum commune (strain H4-8 / FGSC 9210) TaxID=578458 RepID=UPI00215FB1C9|nr:uncharacterized protein SCHCODRAFT_01220509 [Schizophyllum commune H4-8]KAI5893329.1 hypothetical protein SCHCODRAFT_01220509 [Schizophyllum commune H4-8]
MQDGPTSRLRPESRPPRFHHRPAPPRGRLIKTRLHRLPTHASRASHRAHGGPAAHRALKDIKYACLSPRRGSCRSTATPSRPASRCRAVFSRCAHTPASPIDRAHTRRAGLHPLYPLPFLSLMQRTAARRDISCTVHI